MPRNPPPPSPEKQKVSHFALLVFVRLEADEAHADARRAQHQRRRQLGELA